MIRRTNMIRIQKQKKIAPKNRFVVDERRNVVDTLNPLGRKGYCHKGDSEDQAYLRTKIVDVCLYQLVCDLIINVESGQESSRGQHNEPFNDVAFAIWR